MLEWNAAGRSVASESDERHFALSGINTRSTVGSVRRWLARSGLAVLLFPLREASPRSLDLREGILA
jgi:hypothetical protein